MQWGYPMKHRLALFSALSLMLLCIAVSCNESKLAGDSGQRPGNNRGDGDETDDTGHKYDKIPSGQTIVQRVGKLFDLNINLGNTKLPQGSERVRLHVVDADGRELPEAILMWLEPKNELPEWSSKVGTRVMAELDAGQQAAQFEDIFLRVDMPEGASLVVSVVAAGKEHAVRKHPLRSEEGKYDMKVIYAEPGSRGAPVIEFNFDPGIPARHKGSWYVAARTGESNISGYGLVASAFSHLPLPTMKLVAHPSDDFFDKDNQCYVALVNIDDNVKADHFGECGVF